MHPHQRKILEDNASLLNRDLEVNEDFLAVFLKDKILTQNMIVDITEARTTQKYFVFMKYILRRPPAAFLRLIQALVETAQDDIAKALDPGRAEGLIRDRDEAGQRNSGDGGAAAWAQETPSGRSDSVDHGATAAPPSDQGVRQIPDNGEPLIEIDIQDVNEGEAQQLLKNKEAVYPLKSRPRGRAIILNNTFPSELNRRDSSVHDAINLGALFDRLGFEIVKWPNLSAEEIWKHIETERNHEAHADADAFIFAILSHGNRGNIKSDDNKDVSLEKIYEKFDGRMCPGLKGKPKIFFIQACQKDESGGGTPQVGGSGSENEPRDDIPQPQSASNEPVVHDKADCVYVKATVTGYEAKRQKESGAWFVRDLIYTFMERCHKEHLMDMLTVVSRKLEQRDTYIGPRVSHQVPEIQSTGLGRHIYFLPGYYEPDTSHS